MHMTNSRRYFLNTIVELIGIKGGLAITADDALRMLEKAGHEKTWCHGPLDAFIRIEATEFEYVFLSVLHGVGGIPDARLPGEMVVEFCRKHAAALEMLDGPDETLPALPKLMSIVMATDRVLMQSLHDGTPVPMELNAISEFRNLLEQYTLRNVLIQSMPFSKQWDGLLPLSDLFHSQEAPPDPTTYFDQRFIDYLHAQSDDALKMHWRQFERLTAEYFNRNGYEVEIGAGRGDGGKDVVARRSSLIAGPELVLIQCKRYDRKNEVKIDQIKALYQTVNDEKATRGLIATTSALAKGARDYCEANQYRLTMSEGKNVEEWLEQMARWGRRT